MALSNSERIGKGLDLLRIGLVPFVKDGDLKYLYMAWDAGGGSRCISGKLNIRIQHIYDM
jgi:hypothetical protein